MKRLVTMAVTGMMMFALSACGGDNVPPVPDANTDDMMNTPMQQPTENAKPEAANPAAPTDEQMAGAAAQE